MAKTTGPAWQTSRQRRARKFYTGVWLILIFCIIEALLAARIAGQALAQDPHWLPFAAVLFVTDFLVQPFRDVNPEPTIKETGVIEFASLLAFEVYLVAGLVLVAFVQITHVTAWFFRLFFRRPKQQPVPLQTIDPGSQQAESQQAA